MKGIRESKIDSLTRKEGGYMEEQVDILLLLNFLAISCCYVIGPYVV